MHSENVPEFERVSEPTVTGIAFQRNVKLAARTLIGLKRYEAALLLLGENLPRIEADQEHFGLLAAVLLGNGDYGGAADVYASLIRLHPDNPQWWGGYALALEQLGHVESVAFAYQTLHQITAEDSTLGMLARQKLKRYDSA